MTTPIPLRQIKPGPVPEVVETLEAMLAKAQRGEIIGVGIVAACDGRADATAFAIGEGSIASLVLACERLKLRLLREGEE